MSNILFGASGLAGSGIRRALETQMPGDYLTPRREEIDIYDQNQLENYIRLNTPETVIMAAGVVGGIKENISKQANFLISNLNLNINILQACLKYEVPRVLVIASSCIYPVEASQPLQVQDFLKGNPEPTNAGHAIGKTTASWLIKFYREAYGLNWGTAISSSLYGKEDDFSGKGHVIPGLIKRFAQSDGQRIEKIWGSPHTLREFMFNDDLGSAVVTLLAQEQLPELVNVGSGEEVSMGDLVKKIAQHFNYSGEFEFDSSVPAGWPRRVVDSMLGKQMGWSPNIDLDTGLLKVIEHFRANFASNL